MKEWLNEKKYVIGAVLAGAALFFYFLYQDSFFDSQAADGIIAEDAHLNPEFEGGADAGHTPAVIVVDVKGAVKKPGVYDANDDERVIDIIERAGGLTEKADTSAVNFAQKLTDEIIVSIPEIGEADDNPPTGVAGASGNGKININKATEVELQEIPGIGPSKAAAIIEHREKNGPFRKPEDLKDVSGIGEKTYEKLEGTITVH
ncbi:hypothetical protein A8F94_04770 [Bacillus sp. FJAT-27225]|uniref:helix-hairpin-helix domain-containing protein n=1 Tax=Bacillus sp. FJAT-27225 TaxID=1743144 RepID=UPI00080C205E|nr:helix-hairpin-helix domain-containing protein [Bacillus sp. FJAT-27225]OCA91175.1 hypothetical protein A8F94_04770 [Bacillus sp. FJAT-27225]